MKTADGLRVELGEEKRARQKAEADYADALDELEAVRAEAEQRGLRLDTATADLEARKKALEEYKSRLMQLDKIRVRFEALKDKLAKLTQLGLTVEVRDNRMVILLPGDVLFDSGSDSLKKEGEQIVLSIAAVVRADADLRAREFQVAGHTDDRPFKGGPFKDNWGLSVMRARSVLELLVRPEDQGGGGLPPGQWSAAGYGDTDPVADNTSEEGRTRNRRVELVAQPDVAEMLNLNSLTE